MALYEWNDGQLGAVCLQGGPKGEGGLDDATGASGAAGGAGLKQTSATLDLSEHCLGLCGAAWTNRGVSCTCLAIAPSNFTPAIARPLAHSQLSGQGGRLTGGLGPGKSEETGRW